MSNEAVSTQITDMCTFLEGRALVASFLQKGERYLMERCMRSWTSDYPTATPPHTLDIHMRARRRQVSIVAPIMGVYPLMLAL